MVIDTSSAHSGTVATPPGALRVFVVENHDDSRVSLCQLIEALGHTTVQAAGVEEALSALPGADCDVLISDIGLPDGDGWALLRRLQTPRPLYAIAMSGYGMVADHERSKAAGYRHHLVKPMAPEELERILEGVARERGPGASGG